MVAPRQCSGCGAEVSPQLDLAQAKPGKNGEPGGGYYMAAKCPNCQASLGRADGEPQPAPAPAPPKPAPGLSGVMTLGGLIGHDRAAAIQATPAPAAPALPPAADDIVATAEQRLAFVEGEIAKLRGYEDERELLERIIAAVAPQSGSRGTSKGSTNGRSLSR
jgi:hypothetical protein